jgi:hypothetical protein
MNPLSYIGQPILEFTFWKNTSQKFYFDLQFTKTIPFITPSNMGPDGYMPFSRCPFQIDYFKGYLGRAENVA